MKGFYSVLFAILAHSPFYSFVKWPSFFLDFLLRRLPFTFPSCFCIPCAFSIRPKCFSVLLIEQNKIQTWSILVILNLKMINVKLNLDETIWRHVKSFNTKEYAHKIKGLRKLFKHYLWFTLLNGVETGIDKNKVESFERILR